MKWFFVALLSTQAFRALTCAFNRAELLQGSINNSFTQINENECFAKCFENMACIGILYRKVRNVCYLLSAGYMILYAKSASDTVYFFQRDDVDPTGCTRYVGV